MYLLALGLFKFWKQGICWFKNLVKFELHSTIQCTMFTFILQKYEILSPGERIESFVGMEKVFKNGMLGIHSV